MHRTLVYIALAILALSATPASAAEFQARQSCRDGSQRSGGFWA